MATTITSPTFLLAVYFLLFGRIILMLGPQYSRISRKLCEFHHHFRYGKILMLSIVTLQIP